MAVDGKKLEAFMGKMVGEMGAAMNACLILLGDRLGLYKAMAHAGPMTSAEVAKKTGTAERYVREWLNAQAAGGIVEYAGGKYVLPDEQAMALADEGSPAFLCGAYQILASVNKDLPKVENAFKQGSGVGWHEHDVCLFRGTERFFRPGYNAHLLSSWIPALGGGIKERLEGGGMIADVGCGHGASTILMAQAFPKAKIFGYDYHGASISSAQLAAEEAGVADRITFQVAAAKDFPKQGGGYDLVTFFDCLHDMGDPVGAARHVKSTLRPGGTWMVVEPNAGDTVEANLNPIGRMFYCVSTMICTPASLAQEVGTALGTAAGEARLRKVFQDGGFTQIRRAAETPFNMVLEVRE